METTKCNPFYSSEGKLPYLQIGSEQFVGYEKIKAVIEKEGYVIDGKLSKWEDRFRSEAYTNLVFQNLHPYHYYFLFGEPNNYEKTRALYAKRTPFPFNFYYPSQYHKEAEEVVNVFGGFDIYDKLENHDSDYFLLNAKKCINMLSRKLGKKIWFFGDFYSELDTIAYSYLSILLNINLPNNPIQVHIKECHNLVNFINRITKDIFQREGLTSVKHLENDHLMTPSEREFMASKKTIQILAALFAILAMGGYAVTSGILNVTFDRNQGDDMYIYEDDDDGDE